MSYCDIIMTKLPKSTASSPSGEGSRLSPGQYVAIAAFRRQLRAFLAFSEGAAAEAGLPPQQHQALLAIAGHDGGSPPTVGFLADALLIAPQTAAELVARMAAAGLLSKAQSADDRRRVELALTPHAEQLLSALTSAHLRELESLEPALLRALSRARRAAAGR
jgi:DNA-binding MarR family transcriptional regulator